MDYKRLSADRLRSARKSAGWTLADLSSHTEALTPERISNYEQARRYMSPDVARQLSKALNVGAAWLMGIDNDPLTPDEARLISLYRSASDHGQQVIDSVAEAQSKYSPRD